ncbi:MAG: hypothetical protein NTZ46_05735 [Verrucomicrobia bacterium]|nr:hypothetical protein [Verrucomicrobiota bacterium]
MKTELSSTFGSDYHRILLDAMPSAVLVVEEDVRIVDFNIAAQKFVGKEHAVVLQRRAGDLLHCLHSSETPGGCGHSKACRECPIRNSVDAALKGQTPPRQTVKLELIAPGRKPAEALFMLTVAPLTFEERRLALVILEDIREITMLRQMLPICAHCKQVRDDANYWQSVESYLELNLDIDFTHSLCPHCAEQFFPEYLREFEKQD